MSVKKPQLNTALILPRFVEGFSGTVVPLGIAYIAAVLARAGYPVVGYNFNVDPLDEVELGKYDVIGISASSAAYAETMRFARIVKQRCNPNAFVVIGGPHATAMPEAVASSEYVDAAVYGEGEFTMLELLRCLETGSDLSGVRGLAYKKDGRVIITPAREVYRDLDSLPFPNKNVFDHGNYSSKESLYSAILASRGCPYRCANCKPGLDRISAFRMRSPANVAAEMKHTVTNYGVTTFWFLDSELVGPKKWVLDICAEIEKAGLHISFTANALIDRMDTDVIEALKRAGCASLGFGIESGSQRVIDEVLHKALHLDRVHPALKATGRMGIERGLWFMVGIPGETEEEVMQTVRFAQSCDAEVIEVNIATPWPDTEFYFGAKERGWLLSEDFASFNEKRQVVIETPYLSRDQVLRAYDLFRESFVKKGWWLSSDGSRLIRPASLNAKVRHSLRGLLTGDIPLRNLPKLVIKFIRELFLSRKSKTATPKLDSDS